MRTSISLSAEERNTLLDYYRCPFHEPELRLRAHIILLLADGYTWALVCAVLYCSSRTVARWKDRFDEGRVPALLGLPPGRARRRAAHRAAQVVGWVTHTPPRVFGFFHRRWSCATGPTTRRSCSRTRSTST